VQCFAATKIVKSRNVSVVQRYSKIAEAGLKLLGGKISVGVDRRTILCAPRGRSLEPSRVAGETPARRAVPADVAARGVMIATDARIPHDVAARVIITKMPG
jgi:hypothetical protein